MCVTAFISFLSEQASCCSLTINKCFSCSQNIFPQLYSVAIRFLFNTEVVAMQLQNVFTPIKFSSALWETQNFNKNQPTESSNAFWISPLEVSWIQIVHNCNPELLRQVRIATRMSSRNLQPPAFCLFNASRSMKYCQFFLLKKYLPFFCQNLGMGCG